MEKRKKEYCKQHKKKELTLYCVNCDEALCADCASNKHGKHRLDDLNETAAKKLVQLDAQKELLKSATKNLEQQLDNAKAERQAMLEKKATILSDVHDRHALLMTLVDKCRNDALTSLQAAQADIESSASETLIQQNHDLATLVDLQKRMEKLSTKGTATDIVKIAKQVNAERLVQKALDQTNGTTSTIKRPVHFFTDDSDALMRMIRHFIGTVTEVSMVSSAGEVSVESRFRCGQGGNVSVFSLCPVDSQPPVVMVSYDRSGSSTNAPVQEYTQTGKLLRNDKCSGKQTSRRYERGLSMFPKPKPGRFVTYTKSLTVPHYQLDTDWSGRGTISRVVVTVLRPVKIENEPVFHIAVGPHRAVDVDSSQQLFVVVEEARASHPSHPSHPSRKLLLYQRPKESAVATYTPPTPVFQPSDVCFYRLGGQHVLLVTDQANDVIHVVSVQEGRLTFLRYLAPGCPSLIQPTAINVDVSGQLWVACRGGSIITMQPKD